MTMNTTSDFQFFEENLEGFVLKGSVGNAIRVPGLAIQPTRRDLFQRFWRQKLSIRPRWKTCVKITCPPVSA